MSGSEILQLKDKETKNNLDDFKTVLAFGISFPKINNNNKVGKYKVNKVYWQNYYGTNINEIKEEDE